MKVIKARPLNSSNFRPTVPHTPNQT